eukprot:636543-Rhodomonas_salina.1
MATSPAPGHLAFEGTTSDESARCRSTSIFETDPCHRGVQWRAGRRRVRGVLRTLIVLVVAVACSSDMQRVMHRTAVPNPSISPCFLRSQTASVVPAAKRPPLCELGPRQRLKSPPPLDVSHRKTSPCSTPNHSEAIVGESENVPSDSDSFTSAESAERSAQQKGSHPS